MSGTDAERDAFLERSAAYALGALTPVERDAFERELAAHPEWASEAAADLETAARLSEAAVPVAPPASVRAGILSAIQGLDQQPGTSANAQGDDEAMPAPAPTTRAPRSRRRSRVLYTLAACIALIVAVAVGTPALVAQLNPPSRVQTALADIQARPDARSAEGAVTGGGTLTVHWSDSLGRAVVVPSGMTAPGEGRTYELWLVRDGAAIPAGLMSDATSSGRIVDGDIRAGDVVAVTVEQAGGSPSGAPTSTPVVAVPTA